MTKHEVARENLLIIKENVIELVEILNDNSAENWNDNHIEFESLHKFITQSEATEKELALYKKIHEKYQYLSENTNDYDLNMDEVDIIHNEIYELEQQLSKVGE